MAKATRASKNTATRVGERIRQLRKSLGLTQAELAEQTEMDVKSVSRLETGVHAPSLDQLERLASVFQVTMSHFLNEDDDPSFVRGREMASMLANLSKEQQRFVIDFVRLYVEVHAKRTRAG